jgi:hypothetical protein
MTIPEFVGRRWIESLTDVQLQKAERELHKTFAQLETAEKARKGARYELMRGGPALTTAWVKWSTVSAATRLRGLEVVHKR